MSACHRFSVLIPARYASRRFPGKALADLGGKPMVVRVAERARASGAAGVWIATDDERIRAAAEAHGYAAVMTRGDHESGTDRLAEAAAALGLADDEIVVNVQGDEPLVPPALIGRLAGLLLQRSAAAIATARRAIADAPALSDPNIVKVVLDHAGYALYFSRAPIPHLRDRPGELAAALPAQRHLGIYAYRAGFLQTYTGLAPAAIERVEALEQLR